MLQRLELAGFRISPADRLRVIKTLSGPAKEFLEKDITELDQLKYVLAPILTRSAAEQETFYEIWKRYYQELKAPLLQQDVKETSEVSWIWINWVASVLGIGLLGTILYVLLQPIPPKPKLNFQHPPTAKVGETVPVNNISEVDDSLRFRFIWELIDIENQKVEKADSANYHWQFTLNERGNSSYKLIRLSLRELKTDSLYTHEKTLTVICANLPQITAINAPKRITLNEAVNFSANVTGKETLLYEWDFGDGSSKSNAKEPVHRFEKEGQYTVSLTISDPNGERDGVCQHKQTHPIQVGVDKAFLPLQTLIKDEVKPLAKIGLGTWLALGLPFISGLFYLVYRQLIAAKKLDLDIWNKLFGLHNESLKETGERLINKKALITTCKLFFLIGLCISAMAWGTIFNNTLALIFAFIIFIGLVSLIEKFIYRRLKVGKFDWPFWLSIFWSLFIALIIALPLSWVYSDSTIQLYAFFNSLFFFGVLFFLLGFIPKMAVFFSKAGKTEPKKTKKEKSSQLSHADKAPYFIPFRNKSSFIKTTSEQFRLADVMRMRQEGLRREIDVNATVRSTVTRGGFPNLQFAFNTQPTDYLFLIDDQATNSHQAALFKHLTLQLREQDVFIEAFYYHTDFYHFWNRQNLDGLTLEGLRRRYPHFRLVILGDAHSLINPFAKGDPALHKNLANTLRQWKQRILLSPVPPNSWTFREDLLFDFIPIFPSDSKGLGEASLFLEKDGLSSEELDYSFPKWHHLQEEGRTEPVINYRKWKRITALEEYLKNHPKLFDWLCALAVYPSPNWDMTIAIGEALHLYGVEVSYDNLLILARIPWLQNGVFSPKLRKELLDRIDPEIERLAREAVRKELEAVRTIIQGSHASLELETTLAIQNFALLPEDKEFQETIKSFIDQGVFNTKQIKELDETVSRHQNRGAQYTGKSNIQSFLQEANKEKQEPRKTNKAAVWSIAISSIAVIALSAFLWKVDETDSLYQFAFGETPQPFLENPDRKLRDYFYLREKIQLDSATVYNNNGVDQFAIRRSVSLGLPGISRLDELKSGTATALENFIRALTLRINYPLALANKDKTYLNTGIEIYNDFLNDSLSQKDLKEALFYFDVSNKSDSVQLQRLHGLGLAYYYLNRLDSATFFYRQLLLETDSLYFDTLSIPLNLRDLLLSIPVPSSLQAGNCAQTTNINLALRSRPLNEKEINIVNNQLPEKKVIDKKTVRMTVFPNTTVTYLGEQGRFFRVSIGTGNQKITGYISKQYRGKSTLKPCDIGIQTSLPEQPGTGESTSSSSRVETPPYNFSYSSIRLAGQSYRTIELNGQIWLADNLNYGVDGSVCYDNSSRNCQQYGRLYTWDAAQKACGTLGNGWRLPTDEEWNSLRNQYGGEQKSYSLLVKGGASGFEAQLGGNSGIKGSFSNLSKAGQYWTSTGFSRSSAWYYWFGENNKLVSRNYGEISEQRSCRCIYDPNDRQQVGQIPPESSEGRTSLEQDLSKTPPNYDRVYIGQQSYRTIQLAGLIWLADNLNYEVENSYCYDDDPENCDKYGRLYTWEAANQACSTLGEGWRVPSNEDWRLLTGLFEATEEAYASLIAQGNTGFEALLSGARGNRGEYLTLNRTGNYWSSTPSPKGQAWNSSFDGDTKRLEQLTNNKFFAFSCRCVKN